ncbi:hypothetical protein D3C75_1006290 [compost metagenome]
MYGTVFPSHSSGLITTPSIPSSVVSLEKYRSAFSTASPSDKSSTNVSSSDRNRNISEVLQRGSSSVPSSFTSFSTANALYSSSPSWAYSSSCRL